MQDLQLDLVDFGHKVLRAPHIEKRMRHLHLLDESG